MGRERIIALFSVGRSLLLSYIIFIRNTSLLSAVVIHFCSYSKRKGIVKTSGIWVKIGQLENVKY